MSNTNIGDSQMETKKERRARTMKSPLKKIMEILGGTYGDDMYGNKIVMLECGHEIACSGGAIYRARCWKCYEVAQGNERWRI
jgi:hypothetical protein